MVRKHQWFWISLFIATVLLLSTLATGWNIVLVHDSNRFFELTGEQKVPWLKLILGTLGFIAALIGLFLFFIRLLKEMKLNQLQSEFLAAVSHELKTPIATLELCSSLLRSGEPSKEEESQLWSSHDAELKRLKSEVDSLLETARWQSHSIFLNRVWIDLEMWLTQSTFRWQQILGPKGQLVREGDPLKGKAFVDPRLLNLITDNLFDNARKFSKDSPKVTLSSLVIEPNRPWKSAKWRIEIHDEGVGFAPSESGKIFQRFYRAPTRANHAIPGTGLGLFLAKSASQAMNIRLSGESAGNDRGARFTLEGFYG